MVSNEMSVRPLQNVDRMIPILLLVLTAVLTTSQGVVLCFGCDGHVAFEPAGHDCCAREARAAGLDAGGSLPALTSPGGTVRCQSCVDVPVGGSISDRPGTTRVSQTHGGSAASAWVPLQAFDTEATRAATPRLRASQAPLALLHCIVLQV
jgi:hypothetical protein